MKKKNEINKQIQILLILFLLCNFACKTNNGDNNSNIFQTISPAKASELIQTNQNNSDFSILDLRTPSEFATGFINQAININYYDNDFEDQINKLDKNKIYLIYCRSGNRSGSALDIFKKLNFTTVYDLDGGINAWVGDGFNIETTQ